MLRSFLALALAAGLAGCADRAAEASASTRLVEVPTAQALVDDLAQTEAQTVVLNFWATWCAPCVAEFPMLVDYHADETPSREVRFVSVDDPTLTDDVEAFLERFDVASTSYLYTGTGDLASDLNPLFMGGAIPVTMILDGEGTVEYTHVGALTRDELDRLVADAEAARS